MCNTPKPIEVCEGLTFFPTVRNDSLKFYTNDGDGTSKHYLMREDARELAAKLLAWAETPEIRHEG